MSIINDEQRQFYHQNGFLIVENFLSPDICQLLITTANTLVSDFDIGEHQTIFSTTKKLHELEQYFLESGNNISFFFEEGAFDQQGNLTTTKEKCINKIGHALHDLHPIFNAVSRTHKLAVLANDLGIEQPALIQSMYIFKQPFIGGEVTCHQDSTFLYTEPQPITGLWFALQDATIENGCLWAIPGGHHYPIKSRLKRNGWKTNLEVYDETPWDQTQLQPLPVKQGSLIVLHGQLPHMSYQNTSPNSRHAYTLHISDGRSSFATNNWIQRRATFPFQGFLF